MKRLEGSASVNHIVPPVRRWRGQMEHISGFVGARALNRVARSLRFTSNAGCDNRVASERRRDAEGAVEAVRPVSTLWSLHPA